MTTPDPGRQLRRERMLLRVVAGYFLLNGLSGIGAATGAGTLAAVGSWAWLRWICGAAGVTQIVAAATCLVLARRLVAWRRHRRAASVVLAACVVVCTPVTALTFLIVAGRSSAGATILVLLGSLLLAALLVVPLAVSARGLPRECLGCGYDLRGSPPGAPCPECGEPCTPGP
ncbi:MAG: hypothetical protein ACYTG1_01065 [Planctomycetota bacterium]|jgi:hypothetical protein